MFSATATRPSTPSIRAAQKAGPNLTTDSFIKAIMDMGEIPADMFGNPPAQLHRQQAAGRDAVAPVARSRTAAGRWCRTCTDRVPLVPCQPARAKWLGAVCRAAAAGLKPCRHRARQPRSGYAPEPGGRRRVQQGRAAPADALQHPVQRADLHGHGAHPSGGTSTTLPDQGSGAPGRNSTTRPSASRSTSTAISWWSSKPTSTVFRRVRHRVGAQALGHALDDRVARVEACSRSSKRSDSARPIAARASRPAP